MSARMRPFLELFVGTGKLRNEKTTKHAQRSVVSVAVEDKVPVRDRHGRPSMSTNTGQSPRILTLTLLVQMSVEIRPTVSVVCTRRLMFKPVSVCLFLSKGLNMDNTEVICAKRQQAL